MVEKISNSEGEGELEDRNSSSYESEVKAIYNYRDELITLFHKSQDSFEKQLSFISAGALSLSIGFITDIVKPFEKSLYKIVLGWGWFLLVGTLLLNCISHLLAAQNANKAIKEINENKYDPVKINFRNKIVIRINWGTIIMMIGGIGLIIIFITINTLR